MGSGLAAELACWRTFISFWFYVYFYLGFMAFILVCSSFGCAQVVPSLRVLFGVRSVGRLLFDNPGRYECRVG